jgi:exonuclease VII large subunit
MELHKAGLSKASARLEAGNPEGLLNRGYALVKAEGHDGFLRDPRAAPQGTAIRIQLAKGDLRARVE